MTESEVDTFVVGIVHYHASDNSSTQRVWEVTREIADAIADELGDPDVSSLMTTEHMDDVDVAMAAVPQLWRDR